VRCAAILVLRCTNRSRAAGAGSEDGKEQNHVPSSSLFLSSSSPSPANARKKTEAREGDGEGRTGKREASGAGTAKEGGRAGLREDASSTTKSEIEQK
jgi:hypothetical protein